MLAHGWTDAELDEIGALDPVELARRFAVAPAELMRRLRQPLTTTSGSFDLYGGAVRFRPRHPFVAGLTYGWTDRDAAAAAEPLTITRPACDDERQSEVCAIYPTAREVPLNLLRFYIHFSAPMSEGEATRCVRLQAASGEPLAGALLPAHVELWDREHRRLTVLLDPGRIKRGLLPNAQVGYPLVDGAAVALVIDDDWRDAAGARLRVGAVSNYTVGPAVRQRVDPSRWRVDRPRPGTVETVTVGFDRPLDHALLQRCIEVRDAAGFLVRGRATIAAGERDWQFTPARPWAAGAHALTVDAKLEDVAGNSVARVFDRDLDSAQDDPRPSGPVQVDFFLG